MDFQRLVVVRKGEEKKVVVRGEFIPGTYTSYLALDLPLLESLHYYLECSPLDLYLCVAGPTCH